jgi:photosystem II stability/assembly factor-like uncharacterized protein
MAEDGCLRHFTCQMLLVLQAAQRPIPRYDLATGFSISALVMRKIVLFAVKLLLCVAVLFPIGSAAWEWRLIGPEGGDVRSLAYDPGDPNHILLGTSAGQIFDSRDGGTSWATFAHLGADDAYVLDHILFDPSHTATIYVAGWSLYDNEGGDVFRSDDGGRNWRTLSMVHGKSVRAMAMAPSDHNILVIGALDGVFRSRNGGASWERISPENDAEIKNVESVAIDPADPEIIYAGTFHLPWKSEDGGKSWQSIQQGMLLDSDIFSIVIDPGRPATIFISACSGIYKSVNAGSWFSRIKGIPHSAIRTRVLKQDPNRPAILYAGTTGGLWKTFDGGATWEIYSAPDVIVNDILIDPRRPDRVLLATDRGGVLASDDGFDHYVSSNRGFSHRVIGGVVVDHKEPSRLYVGVANDKDLGGFFLSEDGGQNWRQSNRGLEERDVLSLRQADSGVIFAGTNHGIFHLASTGGKWLPAMMILGKRPPESARVAVPVPGQVKSQSLGARASSKSKLAPSLAAKALLEGAIELAKAPRVRSLEMTDKAWYAATDVGLFVSVDQGSKWYGESVEGENDFIAVNGFADGSLTLVSPKRAFASKDDGETWMDISYPQYVTGLYSLTVVPDSSLWLGTREGALHSTDGGKTWQHLLAGLPARNVLTVTYDAIGQLLLATALYAHGVFESSDGGRSWQRTPDAGVSIRSAMNYQGHLLAASSYNGLLLEQGSVEEAADAVRREQRMTPAR